MRWWIFSDDEIGVQFMDDTEESRPIEAHEFSPRELRTLDPWAWGSLVHDHDDAWIDMTSLQDLPHHLRLCNRCGLLQSSRNGIEPWVSLR